MTAGITLLVGCGVWLILLGVYFILLRPALLPEDLRYMATRTDTLREAAPGAASWFKLVFVVLGGYIAGSGVLTILAVTATQHSRRPAVIGGLAVSGALTVATMAAVNFALNSDFKWILVMPALLWLTGLLLMMGQPINQPRP